jgi:hypothetical protein
MTPTPPPADGGSNPAVSSAGGTSGSGSGGSGSSPNPLTVGTHFVKQYYKVLSTAPEQIFRFYQPASVLSQGVGSQIPTPPETLESMTEAARGTGSDAEAKSAVVRDRFVLPGREDCPVRFEFEHGAIDAQLSVNGGVLLVVTGHLVYLAPPPSSESGSANNGGVIGGSGPNSQSSPGGGGRKAFVHTFFLGSATAGGKRSYYVHNDILRFLHDGDDSSDAAAMNSNEDGTVVASNVSSGRAEAFDAGAATPPPPSSAAAGPALAAMEKLSLEVRDDAPGGGVEESKDAVVEDEAAAVAAKAFGSANEVAAPEEPSAASVAVGLDEAKFALPSAKPVPGSWASLVASGSGSTPPTPTRAGGTPIRPKPTIAAGAAPTASKPAASGSGTITTAVNPAVKAPSLPVLPTAAVPPHQQDVPRPAPRHGHARRDPDCTLVVKNIDSDTKESDILGLFDVFAAKTEAKIVGLTVSGHKGIAFIDYDTAAPVLAAVEQHGKEPFQMNGRELDVYQKTLEKVGRKVSGRGTFRGGPPGGASGNGPAVRGGGDRGGPGGRRPFGRGGRGERDRGERGGRGGR